MSAHHPDPSISLGSSLRAAGYTSSGLRELWGEVAAAALERGNATPARLALRRHLAAVPRKRQHPDSQHHAGQPTGPPTGQPTGPHPHAERAALALAFFFGHEVPARAISAVVDAAVALELLAVQGDIARPLAVIRPYAFTDARGAGEWLIASDPDELAGVSPLRDDHVLGVGGAGRTLAGLLDTASVASALDIGCGCGILSLHLRRSADRVVATDISARALRFTELNASMNRITGIETRLGSLFDPVSDPLETFDRIAANPPFVITPRAEGVPTYEYRDGGLEGDALMAAVIDGVGAHLASGGVATLLGNWEYRVGDGQGSDAGLTRGADDRGAGDRGVDLGDAGFDGLERVRGWVDAAPVPLDAWVIERERVDVARYAEIWVRDGGTRPGSAEHDALVEAWLADFAHRSVDGVGLGWVVLRRPIDGPTLARYERVGHAAGSTEGLVAAAISAHDALVARDDAQLAASTFVVAPDVTEARHHVPGEEGPRVIELRQGGALGRTIEVDPALAAVVGASDGDLALGVLIDAVAQLLDVDAPTLRADMLARVRELAFTGFLTMDAVAPA